MDPGLSADERTPATKALASILPSQIIPIEVECIRNMLHRLGTLGIILN